MFWLHYLHQPNPPNVTISKGLPMPQPISQPMDTSMGRPIRDQTPVNVGKRQQIFQFALRCFCICELIKLK